MREAILALNAGSSSLKFGVFARPGDELIPPVVRGSLQRAGGYGLNFRATGPDGTVLVDERWAGILPNAATGRLIDWVEAYLGETPLVAVGHRIVHGGAEFSDSVGIDDGILARLEALTPLAPLHQPVSLAPVKLLMAYRPNFRQIACFDTAFHRTIVPPASRYGLPRGLEAAGVRRYGFHGLSYESIAAQLKRSGDAMALSPESRIIVAHLGNGASLCAMQGLTSVDTTMGFSTLDGLVMGTRPGAIDPGILLYLMQEKGLSAADLENLLYRESGLLGVSEISSDVRTLLKSDAAAAAEALDLFAFQVARQTGALATTLGGVDRFIFTGGIGENAPAIRRMIAERLKWLGAELDDEANAAGVTIISSSKSSILLECRSTQEEFMIASHVLSRLLT